MNQPSDVAAAILDAVGTGENELIIDGLTTKVHHALSVPVTALYPALAQYPELELALPSLVRESPIPASIRQRCGPERALPHHAGSTRRTVGRMNRRTPGRDPVSRLAREAVHRPAAAGQRLGMRARGEHRCG
ncbi:hypothetical protein [Streptomyces sp. SAS_276]|uniref:hypothetical protein n=1 Tax=Streptomyces sp. SAS_276 TaxID=3412745 RepID=UPI00403C93F8